MKPKFKSEDAVRVKKNLYSGYEYGGIYFNPNMEKYRGDIFVIGDCVPSTASSSGVVYILKDVNWYWSDEMLELYIESKPCKFMQRK